jgi:hypothetical protein
MAEISGPPGLRVRHHRRKVRFQSGQVEALELLCIVEAGADGIAGRLLLVEDFQIDLVRLPVSVGMASGAGLHDRALAGLGILHGHGGQLLFWNYSNVPAAIPVS